MVTCSVISWNAKHYNHEWFDAAMVWWEEAKGVRAVMGPGQASMAWAEAMGEGQAAVATARAEAEAAERVAKKKERAAESAQQFQAAVGKWMSGALRSPKEVAKARPGSKELTPGSKAAGKRTTGEGSAEEEKTRARRRLDAAGGQSSAAGAGGKDA